MKKVVYVKMWYCSTHATYAKTRAGILIHKQSKASKCSISTRQRRSR